MHPTCRHCSLAALALLAALPLAVIAADSGDAVTVGRYTTIDSISEAEVDPLAVVAQLRFPRDVVGTVGEALGYLLQRTGYAVRATDEYSNRLFELPLPDSQRQLGPARVTSLAQAIAGNSYRLCIDRFARQIIVQATNSGPACAVVAPPSTAENAQ